MLKTLVEHLKNRKVEKAASAKRVLDKKAEFPFHNELELQIGAYVRFDILDFDLTEYQVKEIQELKRYILGKNFLITDYHLNDELKLRAYDDDPSAKDDNCWILRRYDHFEFDEKFLDVVRAAGVEGETFNLDEEGEEAKFGRIAASEDPYIVRRSPGPQHLDYWDFYRRVNRKGDEETLETVVVEQNKTTGYFTIWRGFQVPLSRILTL